MRMRVVFLGLFLSLLAFRHAPGEELSAADLQKLKRELREIVQTRNHTRMAGLIERLSRLDDPKTVELLVEAAVVVPSAKNYEAAVKAMARFSGEKTVEELLKICSGGKDFRQRVLVLEAFGQRRDALTRKAIHEALRDGLVHVQVAAIHACRTRKEKEAIPPLIDLVEKHRQSRDRTWIEAREALLALTGQDYESVEDWRKFWEAKKDTLDPRQLDGAKGPTKVVVKKTQESVEFFGVEILSQNVVFVIDCSGSMMLYDEDPDFKGKNQEYERQRLTRAKAETLRAVRKLRGRSRFNLIAYNDRVFPWQEKLVPANQRNVESASKFINKFRANGWTHTDEAMEKSFLDPAIDTIVLLSDGAPAKESNPNAVSLQDKILARVKDLNSSRKLRIDTFGFEGEGKAPRSMGGGSSGGGGTDTVMVEFLKRLARSNGGEYRPIR